MSFLADENFPRPALEALRKAGCEVFSVAEECSGIDDEEVAALCERRQSILLTFDKDFGELIFSPRPSGGQRRRPLPYHAGVSGGGGAACPGVVGISARFS